MLGAMEAWSEKYPGQVALCTHVKHDQVSPYINAMSMLAAPSLTMPNWREQFGRMIVEAFACEVPVIGSNSGEIPFVIRDDGLVVPENDADALAKAISRLIEDRVARDEFGKRGLERAHSEYTWSGIAKKTLAFFEELMEARR